MTQTEQPIRHPGFGVLEVQTSTLADALFFPEHYRIIGVNYSAVRRVFELTLMSDALPEMEEGKPFPQLRATHHVEYLPEHPDYRRITTEIEVVK